MVKIYVGYVYLESEATIIERYKAFKERQFAQEYVDREMKKAVAYFRNYDIRPNMNARQAEIKEVNF